MENVLSKNHFTAKILAIEKTDMNRKMNYNNDSIKMTITNEESPFHHF